MLRRSARRAGPKAPALALQAPALALHAALLVGLLATPGLQAQSDGMPYAVVTLDLAQGPTTVALGSEHAMSFVVGLELGNIACPSAATATVTLAVSDVPSAMTGVTHTVTPPSLSFSIPAGVHGRTALPPFEATGNAALSVQVANSTVEKHDHGLNVTATYAGGIPANCQGAMPAPQTMESATHTIRTGARPLVSATSTSGDGGGGDAKGSPGVGPLVLAVALAGAAVAWRRR